MRSYHGPQPEGLAGGYRHRAARRGRQHRRLSLQALVDGRSRWKWWQVRDVAHLYHVIDRLRHLPSVMEVLRKTANEGSPWRFFSQPSSSFCSVSSFAERDHAPAN
ncbi:MAG: hypothetical protein ACLSHC_16460 [Bilophila wadsworthia]